ncbi:uncharacterized protein [Physcomitrium patens]|uniref:Serine aminopeptidase S33 domain-containing protein n=1 Tax=Physcomitrium patens TaxID=3218 RepID=A0A7I4F1Y1_PHYPA|nr:uncharacterized protein LOC112289878 isoform X2 [Physcomitrium patens]|eukprot:XP_024391340.1 uncharacterized protein LOC112289878 isoform X2 [Physcomitrella patens]
MIFLKRMMEQLVNFVIRPPRASYSPSLDLLEQEFLLKGRKYSRKDLQVLNNRGHVLQCSHYTPQSPPDDEPLPCVIYCHGNSGCRADANEAAIILLPCNITVFTLDFSGSGLSDGNYVSLGWNETDDLKAVVNHLRTDEKVSRIGLWGRSMGAVTCLMYGAQDPSIAGMVLDSPFANLNNLMMELVDVYKIRLPKFTVKVAVQYMRKAIQKKARFDIMDLDTVQVAKKSFIPALFGHATDDAFIHPRHSEIIFKAYSGDKNIIKFDGDHNSPRPQFYYDSITIFFYNVLRPPDAPIVVPEVLPEPHFYDDALDLDDVDEDTLYEMLGAVRPPSSTNTGSSPAGGTSSDEEALSQTRSRWQMSRTVVPVDLTGKEADLSDLKDFDSDGFEGTSSCTEASENGVHTHPAKVASSNDDDKCWTPNLYSDDGHVSPSGEKVWGPLLGGAGHASPSYDQSFANAPANFDDEERMVMEAIAASLHDVDLKEAEEKNRNEASRSVVIASTNSSRLDAFRQRLRSSVFRGGRRNGSK